MVWNADTREMLCVDCVGQRSDVIDVLPSPHAGISKAPITVPAEPVGDAAIATDPAGAGITMVVLAQRVLCPCGAVLAAGDTVGRHEPTGTWLCPGCCELWARPPYSADALPMAPINPGVPGRSARREYERRLAGYRSRIRSAHPALGRLILRFADEQARVRSRRAAASGDRRLAKKLAQLGGQAFTLHDRRPPGATGTVDHIVIGPVGVYVIDAKLYANAAINVRRADASISPAADQLLVSGRDGSPLIEAMGWQIAAVRAALDSVPGFADVPVIPVLCFVDGTFPKWVPAEGNVDIDGVLVRGLYGATHLVLHAGPFDLPARRRILQLLDQQLPAD